ncbi:MAG: hypothetical protein ABJO01_02280 [Parasphingorhabdus sp.]|uniref:hypothetical protein n=1 Tax=Parasphingorhabdus sp. TaxID=2709688 RepID=UPI0032983914
MRPQSIIIFERLFLTSLVLGMINAFLTWDVTMTALAADPTTATLGVGFIYGVLAFSFVINILLWFFIARKASKVAKWILIVFFVIGLAGLPSSLTSLPILNAAIAVAITVMQGIGLFLLFRTDAKKWLNGEQHVDLEKTFE